MRPRRRRPNPGPPVWLSSLAGEMQRQERQDNVPNLLMNVPANSTQAARGNNRSVAHNERGGGGSGFI